MGALGTYIRQRRLALHARHSDYSIRAVASRIGLHHSYLSKLERGEHAPLSHDRINALARDLGEDPELLMALGGKLPERVSRLIRRHPNQFLSFIADLERSDSDSGGEDAYTKRLEHRKKELEELSRQLRQEVQKRLRTEKELIEQEAEKQTILTNLKDVMVTYIDRDFNILWVNPAVQELLDCPLEEALGDKCHLTIMGNDEPCPHCIARRALETGQAQEGDSESRDGRRWLVRSVPIMNDSGCVEKVVHFGFDVTDLMNAKDFVEKSELRWKFALAGAQQGVWDWNVSTDEVYYDSAYANMLGYTKTEIESHVRFWMDNIHPEDRETAIRANMDCIENWCDDFETEFRIRTKDGQWRWMLGKGKAAARDEHGRAVRMVGIHTDITEHKQAEAALQQSEERFRKAFDTNLVGMAISRRGDGMYLEINRGFCEITGYERNELLGRTSQEMKFFSPEDREAMLSQLHQLGQVHNQELTFAAKSGQLRTIIYSSSLISIGHEQCLLSTMIDITERKKAEAALLASEAKFMKVFQNAPLLMTISTVQEGRYIDVNDAFVNSTGYSREAALGKTSTDLGFIRPEDRARMIQLLKSKGRASGLELELTRSDGSNMFCMYSGELIELDGQERLLSIATDITDRKQAEEALKASEAKYRRIFENAPVGIFRSTIQGRYVEINPAMADMLGYESPERAVRGISSIADQIYAKPEERGQIIKEQLNSNQITRHEIRYRRRDGTELQANVSVYTIRDHAGQPIFLEGIVEDITERKRIESELHAARKKLKT